MHMDDLSTPIATRTVTLFFPEATQVFNHCTDIDAVDGSVEFVDQNGKHHTVSGVPYHTAEE